MDMPVMTLDQALRLHDAPIVTKQSGRRAESPDEILMEAQNRVNEAAQARLRAIKESALSIGIRGGLAWQLANIEQAINKNERKLDSIYNFAPLMINDRVVPPVISESRDLYNQSDDFTLRLSGAFYRIESQARFSSVPPVWRQYLTFSKPDTRQVTVSKALSPKDSREREIWRVSINEGWRQGIDQANLILENQLDRMNRDLTGMLKFHTFVMQGKISMPAIASESIALTREGSTLAVDETLLRITTLSEFNVKSSDWRATIRQTSTPSPAKIVPVENTNVKRLPTIERPADFVINTDNRVDDVVESSTGSEFRYIGPDVRDLEGQ